MANDAPRLTLHGREVKSVFQLLGHRENDMTFSLGWVLAQCPALLSEFLASCVGFAGDVSDAVIRLQEPERETGITDIEVEVPGLVHVIVEAKRGWNLPARKQLKTCTSCLARNHVPIKRVLVLSECTREYSRQHLELHESHGVPIDSVSWKEIAALARAARGRASRKEKRLLDELLTYLGGLVTMQNKDSNWVYVVSLATGAPDGWAISWIDIVRKRHRYFHPVGGGGGWPKEPPNYIAFRYQGKLQSIHHVENYEVVTGVHEKIPEVLSEGWSPHFLYTLGPAFRPVEDVPTGTTIHRATRVWCMLDTLFTCRTIAEARDVSQSRTHAVE